MIIQGYFLKFVVMNNCSQCGSPIPDNQSICSMCMGDINHGSDGYYQQWALEREQEQHDSMIDEIYNEIESE